MDWARLRDSWKEMVVSATCPSPTIDSSASRTFSPERMSGTLTTPSTRLPSATSTGPHPGYVEVLADLLDGGDHAAFAVVDVAVRRERRFPQDGGLPRVRARIPDRGPQPPTSAPETARRAGVTQIVGCLARRSLPVHRAPLPQR